MDLKPYKYVESRNFKQLYFKLLKKLDDARHYSKPNNYLGYVIDEEIRGLEKYIRKPDKQKRLET